MAVALLAPLPVVLAVLEGPVALVALVFPMAMVAALQLQLQLEPILLLAPVLVPAAVEDEVVPAQPEAVFVSVAVAVPVLFNFTTALKAHPPPTPIYVYEEANRSGEGVCRPRPQ